MNVARMKEILRKEYGICSEEEFEKAVYQSKGVNLGIFTIQVSRKENGKKK